MKTVIENVREFHETYGCHIQDKPGLPNGSVRALRLRLITEEFGEFIDAERKNDLVGIADALIDLIYVIAGTAVSYGLPFEELWREVHASNMSKLDASGKPIFDSGGKVLKGPSYFKPKLHAILEKHGYSIMDLINDAADGHDGPIDSGIAEFKPL